MLWYLLPLGIETKRLFAAIAAKHDLVSTRKPAWLCFCAFVGGCPLSVRDDFKITQSTVTYWTTGAWSKPTPSPPISIWLGQLPAEALFVR
jgi:hypothetical protein